MGMGIVAVNTTWDDGYGRSHREYCFQGVMKKYGKTRDEAVQIVNDRARDSRNKAMVSMRCSQSSPSMRHSPRGSGRRAQAAAGLDARSALGQSQRSANSRRP